VRRFVRVLLRTGLARRIDGTGFAAGGESLRASLSDAEVSALSSSGLVCIEGDTCRPSDTAASWLRRQEGEAGDFGNQHRELAPGPDNSLRDLSRNPLEKLARAGGDGFLDTHHVAAGARVSQWGMRAQLRQRVTMSYDPAQVGGRRHGGSGDIADMAADARKALARLFTDLPRDCADVVLDVCVFEKGLQEIETERGWPRRSAKLVLRIGLDHLAKRLGLSPHAEGRPSARIEAWFGEGFAPTRFE
jgi:hypothetical protein